ncbi:hypothetical protein C1646_760505 [Rhizophagus diaphanus]|nr:hypothetical protein C1646_760505 [Rhizophagus diaphanus] [Rhizophagus sp. MUCL 43196]
MQNLDEQENFSSSSSQLDTNNISMSSSGNATVALDNMSQGLSVTPTVTSYTVPDENQPLQFNIQEMIPSQPIQDYQQIPTDLSPLEYLQEPVVTNEYSFFYVPYGDFQIYHITCTELSLTFKNVSQLINNTDNSSINNIYVFYHQQPEIEKIYKVTCEMISHTFIFQFLNKIIYGIQFIQCEHQQQEFSNRHQENLKSHLKRNFTHYLTPKQIHEQNCDLFYQDYDNYQNYNTNILPFNQDSSCQFQTHIQTKRSNTTKSVSVKHKQNRKSNNNKKKSKKTTVIDSDIEEDCEDSDYKEENKENELALKLKELEYREKDLALKERELALREREAKIRVMELSNCEKERQLNLAD